MSMTFFRSKRNSIFTTLIFGAIILTFILWGGQKADNTSSGVLVEVNGDEIAYMDFQRSLAQEMKMFGQFMGKEKLNDNLMQMIERKVAVGLVMRKAQAQKAVQMGVRVGNEEILETLQKEKAFFDPKLNRFSPDIYQAVLQMNDLKPKNFEAQIREELLISRVRSLIEDSVSVSDAEIEDAYRIEKTAFTLDTAIFDALKLAGEKKLKISDQDLKDYFQKHMTEFLSPEKRAALVGSLNLAKNSDKLPVTDGEVETFFNQKVKGGKENPLGEGAQVRALHILISDSSDKGMQKAREVMKSIRSEDDFRKAAEDFSEDFSNAAQGGDLGYFSEKTMVKPFSEAVFKSTGTGKTLGPVKTNFGYHIIWVVDRLSPEITAKARANQIRYLIRQEKSASQAAQVKEEIKKLINTNSDLTVALKAKGFEFTETPAFDSKSRVANFPFILLQEAMGAPKDKWQGPQESGKNIYVYKITNTIAPQPMKFEEAKADISRKLETEATEKLVKSLQVQIIDKKATWADLSKAGAEIKSTKAFKPFSSNQIPGFGESEVLARLVQQLRPTAPISNPVIQEGKWVFFRASDWADIPPTPSAEEKKQIRAELLSRKRSQIFDDFTQNLLKTAKISKSFRAKYNI